MPHVTLTAECPVHDSFRVRQVVGMFDLALETKCRESFSADVPGLDEDWQIGLIVGPSGSGKTTIARRAFGDACYEPADWPRDRAVIDGFGEEPIKRITHLLTAVGLSSPPAWIKPYHVLSGGERFRCDLARALSCGGPLVVFDEFTSVVDRTAAQIGAAAVAKALRSELLDNPQSEIPNPPSVKRFVAVTCHYDVARWLEPDWALDMATCELHRRRLRRPRIRLSVVRCHRRLWRMFSRHHYLSRSVNPAAECYVALMDGGRAGSETQSTGATCVGSETQPAAVAFCAVLAVPGHAGRRRISRLVVLPDYQGVGIGGRFADTIAGIYQNADYGMTIVTSHPAMIASLRRSPRWQTIAVKKTGYRVQNGARRGRITGYVTNTSSGRAVVSFRWRGESSCP